MRRKRTIYFNDARHYYLFIFEPPMKLEDAWRPVDEIAGTSVDTFAFGVARHDGLFYPTRAGKQFYDDVELFDTSIYWRVSENIKSLHARGLDLLRVLVDRAHEKGLEFIASLRMGSYDAMDPGTSGKARGYADPTKGGRGLADPYARDGQLAVLEELASWYPVDGIELDFAAYPGGGPPFLRTEDVAEFTPAITEQVRRISEMARGRPGKPCVVGARVPPVEKMATAIGIDARTWLRERLIDYVVPLKYDYLQVDSQMPIEWLLDAAHASDVSVYGMLQPFVDIGVPGAETVEHFSPEVMRAAGANYYDRGADGVYTWFMSWPLGQVQRSMLTELGDPEALASGNKRYTLPRRDADFVKWGYEQTLPLEIAEADAKLYAVPFHVADDFEEAAGRIRSVRLRVRVWNLVSADRVTLRLNGESLSGEPLRRDFGWYPRSRPSPHHIEHYSAQWLEIDLNAVRPRHGKNVLEISLDGRPARLGKGIRIDDVEIHVEYHAFPSQWLHPHAQ